MRYPFRVPHENLTDAALVLVGHGSTRNDGSATPVFQHATELRRRATFAGVYEAFWKQPPLLQDVLNDISARRVFIVPLFISAGHFIDDVIPRALGFAPGRRVMNADDATVFYCQPVGTHPRITDVLLSRADETVQAFPFPRMPKPKDTTLFVAGHGTQQNENSRKPVERQAQIIREMNAYAGVHAVFLEEHPRVASCYELALTKNLVVVPFFISDGLHVREDIPVMLGEPESVVRKRLAAGLPTWRNPTQRKDKLVWYTPAVGTDSRIADIIVERAREAAAATMASRALL